MPNIKELNLTNCKCVNHADIPYELNQSFSNGSYPIFYFKADDGYAFQTNSDYISFLSSNTIILYGETNKDSFTDGGTVAEVSSGGVWKDIKISAVASPIGVVEKPFVTIQTDLTNCTTTISDVPNTYRQGDIIPQIIVTSETGYNLSSGVTVDGVTYTPETNTSLFTTENTIFILTDFTLELYFDLVAKGVKKDLPDIEQHIDLTDVSHNLPASIKIGDLIHLELKTLNEKEWGVSDVVAISFKTDGLNNQYEEFTISDNPINFSDGNKTFKYSFTQQNKELILFSEPTKISEPVDTVEPVEPVPGVDIPFTETFIMDSDTLNRVSNVWYNNDTVGRIDDYRGFIYDLYLLPFNIDSSVSVDKHEIILGYKKTNVMSNYISDSIISVELGSIVVNEKYGSIYDYDGVECWLNVPYVKKIKLDVNNVVGHTLSVVYVLNMFSRHCTINVSSTFTGNIIYTDVFEFGNDVPFRKLDNKIVNNELSIKVDNSIRVPFIEVIRPIPYEVGDVFGKQIKEFSLIGDCNNYIEVSDIILNVSCTDNEKDELESILRTGVIIKSSL